MTEAAMRFRPKSAPYRRGGLAFAATDVWVERSPEQISPRNVAVLAADPKILIEGRETLDGDWTPLLPDVRALAAAQLDMLHDRDWAEIEAEHRETLIGDGSGVALGDLDPAIAQAALLGRDLLATIDLHRGMLEARGLWPVAVPQDLFLDFAGRLGTAEGEIKRLAAQQAALKAVPTAAPPPPARKRASATKKPADSKAGA